MSFWSLNHAWDPKRCIDEMARVLRPGGRAVVALEQVEPGWMDLIGRSLGIGARCYLDLLKAKLRTRLGGRPWPVQPDHLLITENDFVRWVSPKFQVAERAWRRGDLTYVLRLR